MNKKLLIKLGIAISIITTNRAMNDTTNNLSLSHQFKQSLNDPYLGAKNGTKENPCVKLESLIEKNFDFWENYLWGFLEKNDKIAEFRSNQIKNIGYIYIKKERKKLTKKFNNQLKFIIPLSFGAGVLTFLGLAKLYSYFRK